MTVSRDPSNFKPRQRGLHRLTDRAVKALGRPGRHADGGGLYIEIRSTGTKAWLFISKAGGRPRIMGLGGYPTVSLAMAREKASAARKALADGGDPFAKRNREAEPTFGEAAGRYVESRGGVWRNRKTCFQWTVALKGHCTPIWSTRVSDVDVRAVLAVLTPLWTTVPVSAARVRNRVELILDFAKAHGWRSGENPARWRGGLAHLLPRPGRTEVRHYKALHYRDVPDLMAGLCDVRTMSARALEFLILTAARSNEVRLMTWDEVDFSAATWTLPGTRMKSGRQHTIPLPAPVLDLLGTVRGLGLLGPYVFAGQKRGQPLGNNTVLRLLHQVLPQASATVHGFRSAFRDWAGDETHFAREVAEAALAHAVGSAVEQAYRRGSALEKRRQLMQAWADFATGVKADAMVVALHA